LTAIGQHWRFMTKGQKQIFAFKSLCCVHSHKINAIRLQYGGGITLLDALAILSHLKGLARKLKHLKPGRALFTFQLMDELPKIGLSSASSIIVPRKIKHTQRP